MEKKNKILIAVGCVIAVVLIIVIAVIQMGGNNENVNSSITEKTDKKSKNTQITLGEPINIEDKIELTIKSNNIEKKIIPTNPDTYYNYYSADDGKEFLNVVATVKNLGTQKASINDVITFKFYLDGAEYEGSCYVEEADKTDVRDSYFEKIEPLENRLVHFTAQIEKGKIEQAKEAKLIITSGKKNYEYSINIVSDDSEKGDNKNNLVLNDNGKEMSINQDIEIADVCKFNIRSISFKNEIKPSNPDGYYTYLPSVDGKVYLDIVVDVTNLKSKAEKQDKMMGIGTIVYDGKYEYDISKSVEEDNGNDLNTYPSLYEIAPLTTMTYHITSQLPSSVQDDGKPLMLKLQINGEKYYINIR